MTKISHDRTNYLKQKQHVASIFPITIINYHKKNLISFTRIKLQIKTIIQLTISSQLFYFVQLFAGDQQNVI